MGVKGIYDGVTIKTGDDERATASAATGHIRTKGDDRAYRAMRDYGGTATRPGVSGPPQTAGGTLLGPSVPGHMDPSARGPEHSK